MSDTELRGPAREDVPEDGEAASRTRSRRERRRRRRRRVAFGLVGVAAAGFVTLDVLSVISQRNDDDTRRALHDRRVAARRATRAAHDQSRRTSNTIGTAVGERDLALWYAAGIQQELDTSSSELGARSRRHPSCKPGSMPSTAASTA